MGINFIEGLQHGYFPVKFWKTFAIKLCRKHLWIAASDAILIYQGTLSHLEVAIASCFLKILAIYKKQREPFKGKGEAFIQ